MAALHSIARLVVGGHHVTDRATTWCLYILVNVLMGLYIMFVHGCIDTTMTTKLISLPVYDSKIANLKHVVYKPSAGVGTPCNRIVTLFIISNAERTGVYECI